MPVDPPNIRRAQSTDIEAIADLQTHSILALTTEHYDRPTLEAWALMGRQVRHRLLDEGEFFVAEVGDVIVGVAGWIEDSREPDCAWPRYVFVAPDAGGRNIGRTLMQTIESAAAASGHTRLQLWSSLNAVGFYRRLGFDEIRSARWPIKGPLEMEHRLMAKTLTGAERC